MSDLKRSCPVCDSWTSAVGRAVRDGEPCPYCGAPAELITRIDELRETNANKKLRKELEAALIANDLAQREIRDLKRTLDRILNAVDRIRRTP